MIQGQIFYFNINFNFIINYNIIVLVALSTGIANLILFYYPNFFCVAPGFTAKKIHGKMVALGSTSKKRTYKFEEAIVRIAKELKRQKKSTIRIIDTRDGQCIAHSTVDIFNGFSSGLLVVY